MSGTTLDDAESFVEDIVHLDTPFVQEVCNLCGTGVATHLLVVTEGEKDVLVWLETFI